MTRVALTGGIASGKSFIAEEFARLGAVIIDSDVLAHEVVAPGTPGLAAIAQRFGTHLLQPDGSLNRAALGTIVFADDEARADLNAIVHPLVRARATHLEGQAPEGAVVIQVVPLLVETGLDKGFDTIIVVDVPVEVQEHRLRVRNALSADEAQARIRAQAKRTDRLAVATHVIDNSGSQRDSIKQVVEVWGAISAP